MTKIFIFTHFGLNIHHSFLYSVTLKGFVFIIGKLVWPYCSDKIVKLTWQRIVIKSWNIDIFLPYRPPLLGTDRFCDRTCTNCIEIIFQTKVSFVWKYCQVCKQPLTLKTDTKKRKYCSSLSKLNVHYAKYGREILNIELGVGVYMNVFLRGTDCFEKSLNYIFFSSCLCILHV